MKPKVAEACKLTIGTYGCEYCTFDNKPKHLFADLEPRYRHLIQRSSNQAQLRTPAIMWFYGKIVDYKISGPDLDIVRDVLSNNVLDEMRNCRQQLRAKLEYYRSFRSSLGKSGILDYGYDNKGDAGSDYQRELHAID